MVKKFICVEPIEGVYKIAPTVPLSKCKACNQKKKYNAYYNAAAHLRRAHFNPKPKSRGKSAKKEDTEKRGGKGGGELPLMNELKPWMQDVEVRASEYVDDTTPDSQEDFVDINTNNNEELMYSQQPMSTMPNNSFEVDFVGDISMPDSNTSTLNYPIANSYPIANNYPTTINNEFFDDGSMQLDFITAQQQYGMDHAMFHTMGVQQNFSPFSPDMYQHGQPMSSDTPPFTYIQVPENQIFAGPGAVPYY